MIKKLNETFAIAHSTLNHYEAVITNIENRPELILNNLYIEGTHDNLLSFILTCVDDEFAINFQKYIYDILIPYLKRTLCMDNIDIKYNYEQYPAMLEIYSDQIHLVDLSIYEKTISVVKDKNNIKLEKNIEKLELEIKELYEMLEVHRNKKEHPFMCIADKPIELLYAIGNTKKHLKKLNNEFNECFQLINKKEAELIKLKIMLEQNKDEFIKYKLLQNELVNKIIKTYNYTTI